MRKFLATSDEGKTCVFCSGPVDVYRHGPTGKLGLVECRDRVNCRGMEWFDPAVKRLLDNYPPGIFPRIAEGKLT